MSDIERQAFEKVFPVPDGVFWDCEFYQYETNEMEYEPDADEYHRMWQVWQAARASSAGAVPEGYVLVPVDPTLDMLNEGHRVQFEESQPPSEIWRAMIAAAPTAPAQEGKQ